MKKLLTTLFVLTAIVSTPVFAEDNLTVAVADTSKYTTFIAPAAKSKGKQRGIKNQQRLDQATMAMTVKQELSQVQQHELDNVLENLKLEQASYLNAYLENSFSTLFY